MEQQEIVEMPIIKEVLLIEDSNTHIKLFCKNLWNLNFQVEIAKDSLTTIKFLQSKAYTLIIMNLDLSDQLGETVIKEVCQGELNQSTPLIICTAHADSKQKQECIDWKADKVLTHRVQIETLEKAIEDCFLTRGYERKFDRQVKTLNENLITTIKTLTLLSQKFISVTNEYQWWKKNHVSKETLNPAH
ncbi:response regulator [Rickettsiella endosymbiont of Dermanyssus gallinae]|uniref:response regulator n=1 Tax=Rickettsiella endosymbiont of Dermanyssus gallinae TaxID=2856608 RepID=UPI001C52BC32|nr:response regulator [Rickettsiella endosymbiont of Dermanyssus gallinae]